MMSMSCLVRFVLDTISLHDVGTYGVMVCLIAEEIFPPEPLEGDMGTSIENECFATKQLLESPPKGDGKSQLENLHVCI